LSNKEAKEVVLVVQKQKQGTLFGLKNLNMYCLISQKEVEQESQHNHLFKGVSFFLSMPLKAKLKLQHSTCSKLACSCLVCGSCDIAPKNLAKTHFREDRAHTTETAETAGGTAAAADAAARALRASRPGGLMVSQEVYKLLPDFG